MTLWNRKNNDRETAHIFGQTIEHTMNLFADRMEQMQKAHMELLLKILEQQREGTIPSVIPNVLASTPIISKLGADKEALTPHKNISGKKYEDLLSKKRYSLICKYIDEILEDIGIIQGTFTSRMIFERWKNNAVKKEFTPTSFGVNFSKYMQLHDCKKLSYMRSPETGSKEYFMLDAEDLREEYRPANSFLKLIKTVADSGRLSGWVSSYEILSVAKEICPELIGRYCNPRKMTFAMKNHMAPERVSKDKYVVFWFEPVHPSELQQKGIRPSDSYHNTNNRLCTSCHEPIEPGSDAKRCFVCGGK